MIAFELYFTLYNSFSLYVDEETWLHFFSDKQSWTYRLNPNPLILSFLLLVFSSQWIRNVHCCSSSGKSSFLFLLWIFFNIPLMQSFNSHPDVSDGDFKISSCQSFCFSGSLLPDDPAVSGYILLKKVSLHYFQNLCTRFVTSVQYEKPLLSSPEVLLFLFILYGTILILMDVPGLSCRKRSSCHFILRMYFLLFSMDSPLSLWWTYITISVFICQYIFRKKT